MTSQINPADIDGNYPIAGVSNNTQGMRDNFTNTRTNFQYAADEITELQNKSVLKAALTGTTLDNNLANNVLYNAQVKGISATVVAIANTSGIITIDCSAGHYQSINMAGNISLSFTSNTWPTAGTLGMVRTQITVDQVGRTLTLPNTVSNGIVGIQGYASNVITFANTGTYEFGFSTTNAGNAITIFDLNRPLSYYSNPVTVAANTVSNSSVTGALTVAGGVGIQGNLYVNGDIFGNVTLTDISVGTVTATGNIVGGNILTGGIVSAAGNITSTANVSGGNIIGNFVGTAISVSGNITGGNVNTAGLVTATGNITGGNLITAAAISAASVSASGNVIGGNLTTVGLITATGNVTGGNILTAGLITATGNITGGNVVTAGLVTAIGNVTGGNLVTSQVVSAAQVCATGNILGGNLNAAGLSLSSNVVSVLQSTANITTTANISGGNILTGGAFSTTANITGGNLLTGGLISATGNVSGGNLNVTGNIVDTGALSIITGSNGNIALVPNGSGIVTASGALSAVGNITGGNINTGGVVSSTGNVVGGNVNTAGLITATGNVTGGNILTAGLVTATGNVTGGNVLSLGIITATGNVTGNVYFGNASQLTIDGTNVVGYKNIPQNSQSTSYTLTIEDAGKHILHPDTDANSRTFTIPANGSVPYPIGTAIAFINLTSQVVTIANNDTMYLSPVGSTGPRSLAQYGTATAIKITSTSWLISGSGLS
jgi:hypothetical protein